MSGSDSSGLPRDLTAVFTTLNSVRTIGRGIESVQGLASRIVVVDSGSSDGTVDRCRELGAEVVLRDWRPFYPTQGMGPQKQFAIDLADHADWILLLDSDESLTPELHAELRSFLRDAEPGIDGAWLKRRHWYKGGWIRAEYPDWQLRLLRRGRGRMSNRLVHETLLVDGPTRRLRSLLRHDSWTGLEDAMTRTLRYARLSADIAGRRTSLFKIAFNGPWAFLRNYLFRGAILDGRRGFEISFVLGVGTTMKHLLTAARIGGAERPIGRSVRESTR